MIDQEEREERTAIATEMLNQIGGQRALVLMTGARDFTVSKEELGVALTFRIPMIRAFVRITLTAADDYTVQIFGGRVPIAPKTGGRLDGIYCENLREAVESLTGLTLRVPRIRRA